MITVGPRVALEVIDWGGRGTPLVFLAGGGNTAHVFDTFAPQFTDDFHVVGITRRGFGAAAGAPPAADLDTLVADVTAALDSLRLEKVVLVGHSIAGEEMTRFAEQHGAWCEGLVYLDAAYDRSGIDSLASRQPPAPAPRISAEDTASFASIRALYARVMGVEMPESEIRATERFDAANRYRGSVTSNVLKARLASGKQVARYDRVHCRALAVYALADSVVDVVPYYEELDAAGRAQAGSLLAFVRDVVADSRARITRLPQFQVVDVHHSNHYVFLQHPSEVARAMRKFLMKAQSRIPKRLGLRIALVPSLGATFLVALHSAAEVPPTIVLDPGHPSEVSGGATIQNGTSEVHIAWQVAQRLATLLRAHGYRVVVTKPGERVSVTNVERARIGNAAGAALIVRLHCDASKDSGFAIYHPDRQGRAHGKTGPSAEVMRLSAAAAESMHVSMSQLLAGKLKDGGVRGDSRTAVGEQQGALTGSIFSEVPVVLIEMVTLSNAHDAAFIKTAPGQSLMAQAIALGVARFVPASNSPRLR